MIRARLVVRFETPERQRGQVAVKSREKAFAFERLVVRQNERLAAARRGDDVGVRQHVVRWQLREVVAIYEIAVGKELDLKRNGIFGKAMKKNILPGEDERVGGG